jgi:hypothetical protein
MKYGLSTVVWVTPLLLLCPLQSLWAKTAHDALNRGRAAKLEHPPTDMPQQTPLYFFYPSQAFEPLLEARDQQLEKVSGKARKVDRSEFNQREFRENHLSGFLTDYIQELRACASARPKNPKALQAITAGRDPSTVKWPLHREDASSRLELPEIVAALGANQVSKREAAAKFLFHNLDTYADELQSLANSATDKEVELRSKDLVRELPARKCVLLAQQRYAEKIFREVYPEVPFAACGKEKQ